ncbi:hypothetical protein D7193_30840 [Micromonospora costi]|uniref:Uncharacterized protein n=1 Tax=Micromonospora costi TaxID=1530042 RepID=A0A3A9ZR15_9ACTN|nr:hypothetical protein D7193_30840 [Micromonospora costi]
MAAAPALDPCAGDRVAAVLTLHAAAPPPGAPATPRRPPPGARPRGAVATLRVPAVVGLPVKAAVESG